MVNERNKNVGLTVHNVSVHFGATEFAVNNVSFNVQAGEIVALVGPSGCGKSTLLRAIAGLEPLHAGCVCWEGSDLVRTPPHRRNFGLMFQDGQLFVHKNVAENIAYGLRVQGYTQSEREARVADLLDMVDLVGYEKRQVTELSGGERQRVALARSLAPRPRLLLLDEPLSALDAELRIRLANDLATLLRRTRTTAIMVTHDPHEAATIADRTLQMNKGKII